MTDKEIEQQIEKELGQFHLIMAPSGRWWYTGTRISTAIPVEVIEALISSRREVDKLRKLIDDAPHISASPTVKELNENLAMLRTEWREQREMIANLRAELDSRPESELKVQEIIALIEKLDDFCIEQFKKRLAMYVDEARSLPDCPQQEREDWTSSILYNIKTDLENYLKQIFPVTDSRPESELVLPSHDEILSAFNAGEIGSHLSWMGCLEFTEWLRARIAQLKGTER